ncbi:MAG: threonylcarbamoyl-AMP synthase [Proteobacteria bacterium]|nr:MAG: threonylcarbamoyl-AMP synthase [Pseudomonadota bacterium]QKK12492.1 MAG: threonylcarbamoyl-AMP synthase [Pseudomonadota bacterium]
MSQFFQIHPDNPQVRLVRRAGEILRDGGLIIYPTDSSYALGCCIGNKEAQERIRAIRRVDESHNFTLVCRDLTDISTYAKVDNVAYRLLKSLTPGPYTFLLMATREVPRRLQNPKRRTIGLRVPDNLISQALLAELGEPLMSSTLQLPGGEMPLTEPHEMRDILGHAVDLVIDGGHCGFEPTTVLDLTGPVPEVVRAGKGDVSLFQT